MNDKEKIEVLMRCIRYIAFAMKLKGDDAVFELISKELDSIESKETITN